MTRVTRARVFLSEAEIARLSRLWKQGVRTDEIAEQCGTTVCAIHGLAYRLRERFPKRGAPRHIRRAVNHKWTEEREAEHLKRLEEALKVEPIRGPIPTTYRCWKCSGRCDSPRGHPGCRYP